MNRAEYVAAVGRSLNFLDEGARAEVLADMDELYDGLYGRDMSDEQVQQRIGSPAAVAAEYRLVEELDRIDRSPGTAAGLRIGLTTLSGRLARGAAFQLLGLVWFALAIIALAAGICVLGGIGFAVGAAVGFDPFVTTLAVPGIPRVSGVLMGLAVATASLALLLTNRVVMRALSRFMRKTLRRGSSVSAGDDTASVLTAQKGSRGRWINSGRATWQVSLAALALAVGSAGLMLIVPAPEFPLVVDQTEPIQLQGLSMMEVRAEGVEVLLVVGDTAGARLTADMKRTFLQSVELLVTPGGSATVVEAVYNEGLSWGINTRPLLVVTVPAADTTQIVVHLSAGAEVDVSQLPESVRSRVTVEQ